MAYEPYQLPYRITGDEDLSTLARKVKAIMEGLTYYVNELQVYENGTGVPTNDLVDANKDSWSSAVLVAANAQTVANTALTTVDSKIETFYETTAPHSEYINVPDNADYNKLVGDMWYDSDSSEKKTYMYTKTANGGNFDYKWTYLEIPVSVFDTIDTKRTVFMAEPTVPYYVGDLWLTSTSASSGDIKKCITQRLTGTYTASEWVIATKYTDDTTANNAINLLSDIANDNKLTPVEKTNTKVQWDAIVAEKTTIDAQATSYGITTEKTNYDNSYTTLSNYITPLLTDLTTTSDIVGTTFRANFTDYYNKRTILYKVIAEKALIAGNSYNNVVINTTDGIKATHSDGSYTQLTGSGLERYVSGISKKYHYLIETGSGATITDVVNFTQPADVTITLPADFRDKDFRIITSLKSMVGFGGSGDIDDIKLDWHTPDYVNATFKVTAYCMSWISGQKFKGIEFTYTVIV